MAPTAAVMADPHGRLAELLAQATGPGGRPIVVGNGLELLGSRWAGEHVPLPIPVGVGICLDRSCGWGYLGNECAAATVEHARTWQHRTIPRTQSPASASVAPASSEVG